MAFFFRSNRTPPPPAPDESLLHVPLRTFSVPTLGLEASVTYLAPGGEAQASDFERAVRVTLKAIEAQFSTHEPGSVLSRINAAAGRAAVSVDRETENLFELADSIVFMTQGRVDPTVLPLLALWRAGGDLPAMEEVAAARALVGWSRVQRTAGRVSLPTEGMGIDFGCFLTGMAAETIAVLAKEKRIPSALANVGPVHRAVGAAPGKSAWEVPVPTPAAGGVLVSASLMDSALAIAGGGPGFQVGGRRTASIIDLKSGWPVPPQTLQAVVIGPSALKAPAMAMAAFIQGPPQGIDFIQGFPGFEGRIETVSGRGETRDWRHRTVRM